MTIFKRASRTTTIYSLLSDAFEYKNYICGNPVRGDAGVLDATMRDSSMQFIDVTISCFIPQVYLQTCSAVLSAIKSGFAEEIK